MSKISVLPDNLINKIAAGEVIERPASVVRELIDNSIDAGASRIDVEALYGGSRLIKVSDNGCGMDRDDAVLCFERHATSKIRSEDDLFDISTLGFRGEALPAIASVSKVTLTTSAAGAAAGVRIEIGANRKKEVADAPPLKGTTVEIRDIFYNTPARRKFLKTVPTELSHIVSTVTQKAFAYPQTAFSLRHNNSELLNVPPARDLKERFVQLYGSETAQGFVDVKKDSKAMKVRGFISAPEASRAARSHQTIFVNSRPVRNSTINHAVYDACRDMIPRDRHPSYFIFLDVDPHSVDVNVHPAKSEVKFERPDDVHGFVRAAVYEALNPGSGSDVPHVHSSGGAGPQRPDYQFRQGQGQFVSEPSALFNTVQTGFFSPDADRDISPFFHIGESFVATVTDNGLLIIDRHAAHERINYEKFLMRGSVEAEPLFLPLRIELPVREYNIVIKQKEFLKGIGLDIEDFGNNNVIVRTMPGELRKADIRGILIDAASAIIEEDTTGISGDLDEAALLKDIAARLACHKSVRGKEHLNNEEMRKMLSDLDKTEEPGKCPHGRPTRILLS
ncbi:MAG: DNA mismatch repair endonuclease MutL, partial [Nitrospirota bacterium]|nr:DNA mismatch repair endonuclease MutL [Nitrospirota bacterium]